jgi:hypothetical protein
MTISPGPRPEALGRYSPLTPPTGLLGILCAEFPQLPRQAVAMALAYAEDTVEALSPGNHGAHRIVQFARDRLDVFAARAGRGRPPG